jgi:arylsulfatase A-like enzyme
VSNSAQIEVSRTGGDTKVTLARLPAQAHGALAAAAQVDLELETQSGALCLTAQGGPVAVTEPRLLAPEPPGSDPRPRFVVLTILDAQRPDVLTDASADRIAPRLAALSRKGLRFSEALSPGAHTRAAVFSVMTGRDMMRIDPWLRVRFNVRATSASLLLSRPNLFLTRFAESAGYHSVFLGNNAFFHGQGAFSRFSNHGSTDTGTVATVADLPALLARYSDERIFLVYYVSAPHTQSGTPRRLYDALGCDHLPGVARERCAYEARVRHTDEAVGALLDGIEDYGLSDLLHVVTADHGELFGDGWPVETEIFGQWFRAAYGHGASGHWNELHVPLFLIGRGIAPGVVPGRVSTLDIAPTLMRRLGITPSTQLDGHELPLTGPGPEAAGSPRKFVSYSYCTHSVIEGDRQLIVWQAECARRRTVGRSELLPHRAELFVNGRLVATERTQPGLVQPLLDAHAEWVAERLPAEALLVDTASLPPGSALVVTAPEGRIVDHGPSAALGGLASLRTELASDGRRLLVTLADYRGAYSVTTWPVVTPVTVEVRSEGARPSPLAFVGPLQLPVPALFRRLDRSSDPSLWVSVGEPPDPPAGSRLPRLWWQPYRPAVRTPVRGISDLDRVLREWGYIR